MAEVTQSIGVVVDDREKLDRLMDKVSEAQMKFRHFTQEDVDRIFTKSAVACSKARVRLAQMAVQEGGMGILEDKTIKNHFASEFVHSKYLPEKTCGVVERDESGGYVKVAEPIGLLAGIVPCTNPTSTTIFKCLIALKTRNCIVFSPHPRTAKCTIEAARIVRDAAIAAGAPQDVIGWIDVPTVALCSELMQHPKTIMIVATGAGGLVKAAYSSGKPAMGGGAGNTPVLIDETADIAVAVNSVLLSKTFDNGMICASEQCIVAVDSVANQVLDEFVKRGAYILDPEEKQKVGEFLITDKGGLNPEAVGQPAWKLAEMAGLTEYPSGCRVLVGEITQGIGPQEPLSHEKLAPCLGFIRVKDFEEGLERSLECLEYGGMGHTSVLYTDPYGKEKDQRVGAFQHKMPTGRTLVNMPTSQGAIGDVFNFRQMPSLSLGCGSWGMNASSEGLQPKHLLNYKACTERREHILWFHVPAAVYFNRGIMGEALKDLNAAGLKRAFIVTDNVIKNVGIVKQLTNHLTALEVSFEVFSEVLPQSDVETCLAAVRRMQQYQPDCMIAIGGGSPIDIAKIMRIRYEHPEVDFADLSTRIMDMRKRLVTFPLLGKKIKKVIAIPTTSGTGAEMTPFCSVVDSCGKTKRLIVDMSLTPDIAIVDSDLCMSMPKSVAAQTGFLAICHAIESYVSMFSSEFTQALSLRATRLIFANLDDAVNEESAAARDLVHKASSIAGMAIANALMGVAHAMANQLDSTFQIPLGLGSAMVICQVIKYNAEDAPSKQGTFPQYGFPKAKEQYAEIADALRFTQSGQKLDEKVDTLVCAIDELKKELAIPSSIRDFGINEETFMREVDQMSLAAFDDQCTGTNPRYPLVVELRQLFLDAYNGEVLNFGIGRTLERKQSLLKELKMQNM